MNIKYFIKLSLLPLIITLSIPANSDVLNSFSQILKEHSMIFTMPKEFKQIPVKENDDVLYQYAVKSKKNKLEIRYSVFSLKQRVKEYEEWKNSKNRNGVMTDPNTGYTIFTRAVVENIAGSENFKETLFNQKNVKDEFNADWGGTYLVESKSGYGEGFKYALITALHKDNVADAYIVYLFDDFRTVQSEIMKEFYSMRFMSDYFNKKSVLFSATFVLSVINKESISPLEIGKNINFNESDKRSIDDYLVKIAEYYSLKINKADLSRIKDIIKLINDGYPIVIIYDDKKLSHSAVIKGYNVENEKLLLRVYDSGMEKEDFIDAVSLISDYRKMKPVRGYYFTK